MVKSKRLVRMLITLAMFIPILLGIQTINVVAVEYKIGDQLYNSICNNNGDDSLENCACTNTLHFIALKQIGEANYKTGANDKVNYTCTKGIDYISACKCTTHVRLVFKDGKGNITSYNATNNVNELKVKVGFQFGYNFIQAGGNKYCGQWGESTLPALGHTNDTGEGTDDIITEPTCTEEGNIRHKCKRCEHSTNEKIKPLGHDWGINKTEDVGGITKGHKWEACKRDNSHKHEHQYKIVLKLGTGIDKIHLGNTASGETISKYYNKNDNPKLEFNADVKTGYTWKKWESDDTTGDTPNKSNRSFSIGKDSLSSPHRWVATATANKYKLQYLKGKTQNNSGSISDQNCTYDSDITLKKNAFTGRKYTVTEHPNNGEKDIIHSGTLGFKKWNVTKVGLKNPGDKVKNLTSTPDDTVNATAQWNDKTISFNKPSVTPRGYHFKNWTTDAAGKNVVTELTISPSSESNYTKNVYAQWDPNKYTIHYSKGTTDDTKGEITQQTYYDSNVTMKSNNVFKGRNYSVEFIANDNIGSTKAVLPNNLNGNLSFSKWKITKADSIASHVGSEYSANETITKANFTSKDNGNAYAEAQWSNKSINLNSHKPTRVGYIFLGWYDSATGGTKKDSLTITPGTNKYTIQLYAHWQPITYKIRYNGNGNWNTEQKAYTQTLTFDKKEALIPNKFTRLGGQNESWGSTTINESYSFYGWTQTQNSWTLQYNDKAEKVFNLSTTQDTIIDFYVIWKKPVTLTFNLNGGIYNAQKAPIVLKSTIWNTKDNMIFNIAGGLTPESINKNNKQENNILAYGSGYNSNGVNTTIIKQDEDGQEYRFLGWSTNPDALEPLGKYDVYNNHHDTNITIYDNLTLYAVYEPILTVQVITERVLGDLEPTLKKQDIATAIKLGTTELVIRPGEQAQYTTISKGTNSTVEIKFDDSITKIYDNHGLWTDNLNKNPSIAVGTEIDRVPITAKHGLNRILGLMSKQSTTRKFNIPQYLGTKDSEPSSIDKKEYQITFTFTNQNSYYWNKYKGQNEKAVIKTKIGLLKDGDTIENVIDLIRTKIKN